MGQGSPSLQLQARFAEGNIVDRKAQDILFSDGITVPFSRNEDAIDTTSKLMADAKVDRINQPTLRTPNGEVARLDSMERTAEGWNHEEVKSGLSVKNKHKFDALVSTDRALRAGVSIEDTWLVHLNRKWRLGDPDLDLFSTENITGSMSDPDMVQFLADTTSKLMACSGRRLLGLLALLQLLRTDGQPDHRSEQGQAGGYSRTEQAWGR